MSGLPQPAEVVRLRLPVDGTEQRGALRTERCTAVDLFKTRQRACNAAQTVEVSDSNDTKKIKASPHFRSGTLCQGNLTWSPVSP